LDLNITDLQSERMRYGHVSGISKDAKQLKIHTFGYISDEVLLLHVAGQICGLAIQGFDRKHDAVRQRYDCLRI